MARILGPKCRVCRREAMKLYLRGTRCEMTAKCPIDRGTTFPGQHGQKRQHLTDYGVHMREMQKAKRYYGVSDRQFRRYFRVALGQPGNTGENLLILLERRLDNVIYRAEFAVSRTQARQQVVHGHWRVNGRRVTIPSYGVLSGDVVTPDPREGSQKLVKEALSMPAKEEKPSWLKLAKEPPSIEVIQLPARAEVPIELDEQLIVEFYSR
ncbi:MAG: 30S ribosomal protein S4 [Planctomycetota bacterium]|nr:30S ribosomal protein S4 [Planctomycetota bacterium]